MSETENKTPTAKKSTRKKLPETYEAAAARLNEIVASLETGTAPLDTSLALYEEGIALVRFCNEKLDAAEQQVKILTRDADGEVIEKDFLPQSTDADTGKES